MCDMGRELWKDLPFNRRKLEALGFGLCGLGSLSFTPINDLIDDTDEI
jgi:hypothetical protein